MLRGIKFVGLWTALLAFCVGCWVLLGKFALFVWQEICRGLTL